MGFEPRSTGINLLVFHLLIDCVTYLPGMTLAKAVRVDGNTSTAINTWAVELTRDETITRRA